MAWAVLVAVGIHGEVGVEDDATISSCYWLIFDLHSDGVMFLSNPTP